LESSYSSLEEKIGLYKAGGENKMKKFVIALLSIITLFTLAACDATTLAPNLVDFSQSQEKVTTITVWMDDSEYRFRDAIIPAFYAVYPNIEVKFQHMGALDSRDRLKTYGASGNGCDVFMFPHDHLSLAIAENLVYTLPTTLYDTLSDTILEVAMDIATAGTAGSENPTLYAVPISIESIFLMYNKDLITAEQVAELDTWEEIIAYAPTYATENPGKQLLVSNSHWADNYYLQTIYSAFGWRPHGTDGTDPTQVGFESTNLFNALTWIDNELRPIVTGNNVYTTGSTSMFEEGNGAIMITGPWAIATMETSLGAEKLGAAPMPTFAHVEGTSTENATFPASTFAGSQMVAVYKFSKNLEAAIAFVTFLSTPTAEALLYETSNDCPALIDLSSIPGIADDQYMQVMTAQLASSIPMPTIKEVTYYWAAAQTMVVNIWNTTADIATEQKKAEASYLASKALGS
jgi:arabinogalactan oligomer/maltooligosaccharide transport system substrate-binding protein